MQLKKWTQIILIISFSLLSFGFEVSSMAQQIKPVADSPQQPGTEFTVDIRIENVDNLFGVSFLLHYTHNTNYIDALSAVKGDFLGDNVLFLDPVIDDAQGTVSIGITRKRPAGGVNGSGVVAKVTFQSESTTPNGTSVDFTITNITANDPDGTAISLTPQYLTVTINPPITHAVTITSGPTAAPNTLSSSGGDVNLSVTAGDSLGHAINYSWSVSPNEGSFDDANKQNPTWTAPANPTASNKTYTLTVTVSCNIESTIKDTGSVQVTVEGSSLSAIIKPIADSPQQPGAEFTVDIRIENVDNLFGVSFLLHYTRNTDYIDALPAVKGDFLGDNVLFLDPVIDDAQGTISIGITRKRPADGVNGSGVVAKVTFQSESTTPNGTSVDFTITNITANDPDGTAISLTPQPITVTVNSVECLRGDVSGDGTISAYDASLILKFVVGLIDTFPADASPISNTPRNYSISVPHLKVAAGNRINVPIIINDASGITSGGIVLRYNPNVLHAVNVFTSDMLSGYYWNSNIKRKGEVRIAFAGPQTISGESTLFYVEFEVLPNSDYGVSPLILDIARLSDNLNITKINGSITIPPPKSKLLQNYPNPFNPETWIPYQLSEDANVQLFIYNLNGQIIRTLKLGFQPAGTYIDKSRAIYWDGRNDSGERVSSGVYFYGIKARPQEKRRAGNFSTTRKMVILK